MKNLLAGLLILSTAAAGVHAQDDAASAKQWTRISGIRSAVVVFETAFIEKEADWTALWKRHAQGDSTKALPLVNWETEKIVAVFLGQRKTAGHRVSVTTFVFPNKPTEALVVYKEIKPDPNGINAQMMCSPYAFVKVPKKVTVAHFEKDRHYSYPKPEMHSKAETGRVGILPTHTQYEGKGQAEEGRVSILPTFKLHEKMGKAEGTVRAYQALLESRGL